MIFVSFLSSSLCQSIGYLYLKTGQTSEKGSTGAITDSEGLFQLQNCGEKSIGSLWSWKPGVNFNHQFFVFQKASPFFHLCISFHVR
jgi:hypothetical protein